MQNERLALSSVTTLSVIFRLIAAILLGIRLPYIRLDRPMPVQ